MPNLLGMAFIMFVWSAFGVLLIFSAYFIACELRDFFNHFWRDKP